MNRAACLSALSLVVTFSATNVTWAEPRLDAPVEIDGAILYPDHQRDYVFYRKPSPVRLVTLSSGRADIDLTLTYYQGSRLRDDAGTNDVRWALRVGVERVDASRQESLLRQALTELIPSGRSAVIRPLSILGIPSSVEYAPIDTPDERVRLSEGHLSVPETEEDAVAEPDRLHGSQWTRRSLSFALERHDGTVLREAMESGGALMSLSFSYRVRGLELDPSVPAVFEPGETGPVLDPADPHASLRRVEKTIAADAVRVEIDAQRFPEFLRIVDLNSLAPPGYPGLTVICSDFVRDSESWLYEEKQVQFEAVGVTGKPVRAELVFPGEDPMVSLARVSFPYAVRVDKPYRYRVRSFSMEGDESVSDWTEQPIWAAPLDISGVIVENESGSH